MFRNMCIILISGGIAILLGVCYARIGLDTSNKAPELAYTIDGCDLYRFTEDGEKNFFVRCANGKAATTYSNGKQNIVTEPR